PLLPNSHTTPLLTPSAPSSQSNPLPFCTFYPYTPPLPRLLPTIPSSPSFSPSSPPILWFSTLKYLFPLAECLMEADKVTEEPHSTMDTEEHP
ncbi:unnamed protein product, partial [Gulo gulo]